MWTDGYARRRRRSVTVKLMRAAPLALPEWAHWNPSAADSPWTVGIEEEGMLLEPAGGEPAWRSEDVLMGLAPDLVRFVRAETHACALELATDPHPTVGEGIDQLGALRARLARSVRAAGMGVGVAGTHPLARSEDAQVSTGARYRELHSSLRWLARREPTFALHVHVGVPDADRALRAFSTVCAHLRVLLAVSANSPFLRGCDTGLASACTPVFQAFPRSGLPRAFPDYESYVRAIDVLVVANAIPEPTFIWWDARLQPRLGTLEVRVMDAQTRLIDTAALAALVQCVVRLEATEGFASPRQALAMEVLDENRFLASRDGTQAMLIDVEGDCRMPLGDMLEALLVACAPHARDLGCEAELAGVRALLDDPGDERQRRRGGAARGEPVGAALGTVVEALAAEFTGTRAATSGTPGAAHR